MKEIHPCYAHGVNLQGWLGLGLWWGQLLFWPALAYAALRILYVVGTAVGQRGRDA